MSEDPDRADLLAFRASGERRHLSAFWERHAAAAWRLAHWICPERADDAVQEAAVQVVRQAAQWRDHGPGSASGWLMTIVANAARMERRRARRRGLPLQTAAALPAPAHAAEDERHEQLRNGLAALAARDRHALELRYGSGLDYTAVAAALGIPERTARTRVGRALERLRRRLGLPGEAGAASVVVLLAPAQLSPAPAHVGTLIAQVPATLPAAATTVSGGLLAGLACSVVLGAGTGLLLAQRAAPEPPPAAAVAEANPQPPNQPKLNLDEPRFAYLSSSTNFFERGWLISPAQTLQSVLAKIVWGLDVSNKRCDLRLDPSVLHRRRARIAEYQQQFSPREALDRLAADHGLHWEVTASGSIIISMIEARNRTNLLDASIPVDPTADLSGLLLPVGPQTRIPPGGYRSLSHPDLVDLCAGCVALPSRRDPLLLPSRLQYLDALSKHLGGSWYQSAYGFELTLPIGPTADSAAVASSEGPSEFGGPPPSQRSLAIMLPTYELDANMRMYGYSDIAVNPSTGEPIPVVQDVTDLLQPYLHAPLSRDTLAVNDLGPANRARLPAVSPTGATRDWAQHLARQRQSLPPDAVWFEATLTEPGHAALERLLRSLRAARVEWDGIDGFRSRDRAWRARARQALSTTLVPEFPAMPLRQRLSTLVNAAGLALAYGPRLARTTAHAPASAAGTVESRLGALPGIVWSYTNGLVHAELDGTPTAELFRDYSKKLSLSLSGRDLLGVLDSFTYSLPLPGLVMPQAPESPLRPLTLHVVDVPCERVLRWLARQSGMRLLFTGPEAVLLRRWRGAGAERRPQHHDVSPLLADIPDIVPRLRRACSLEDTEVWRVTDGVLELRAEDEVQNAVREDLEWLDQARWRPAGRAGWLAELDREEQRWTTQLDEPVRLPADQPPTLERLLAALPRELLVICAPELAPSQVNLAAPDAARPSLRSWLDQLPDVTWSLRDGALWLRPRPAGTAAPARPGTAAPANF